MANCEFSETQFLFAFTHEILNRYETLTIPCIPTLREEKNVGWDLKITIDPSTDIEGSIFFQFKRPVYIKKQNKYKIEVNTKHHQFNALKTLKINKPANLVYYATPNFHAQKDYEEYFNRKEIEKHSILFPIENFPADGEHKHLYYLYENEDKRYGELHSQKVEIECLDKIEFTHTKDKMTLFKKAEFLSKSLNIPIPSNSTQKEVVETFFQTLVVQYNILWIPILDRV